MTKAELFAKLDSTWLSVKRKQELKTAVDEYTAVLIAAKPLVSGSVVTEVRKRKLGKYEFYCSKCNTIHQMSSYAIAQRTMGHKLIFTCTCGNKIDL